MLYNSTDSETSLCNALYNSTDNETSLQENLQKLQREKNELESEFGQKRAMFMELFKTKEGTRVHNIGSSPQPIV